MGQPNWARLYQEGRCKAVGVAWTDKEAFAVSELEIPAEFVRQGCLNVKEYEEALAYSKKIEEETGEKPLNLMRREELIPIADELEIPHTDVVTNSTLVAEIKLLRARKVKKEPVEETPKKRKTRKIYG